MPENQLVWFKRDLRIEDHEPLARAAALGPCLCVYIYEPDVINAPDFDPSHLVFINQGLMELRDNLQRLGTELMICHGDAVAVLQSLHADFHFSALRSHQETGNAITYERDRRVLAWASSANVQWCEYQQQGVFRALRDRDGWASRWNQVMRGPAFDAPQRVLSVGAFQCGAILTEKDLGLPASSKKRVQPGGSSHAMRALESFLNERGEKYRTEMSSPNTAVSACSRLSPYLAYGQISMRTVLQTTELRQQEIRVEPKVKGVPRSPWGSSMASFSKRLRWHCHFIQKLESQPSLEFQNMARAYDGLRENDFRQDWFTAWKAGQTGYPMVDACMRSLHETGWVNFRMRAMLMSFASYHLWLDWRPTAVYLATQFIDYEPGIHYSQAQMQSGTTGINAIRIYSPTKQVLDQDPDGEFIKRWVPELHGLPAEHIAQPALMSAQEQSRYGCQIGRDYPAPLVIHKAAVKEAKQRIFGVKKQAEAKSEAQAVFERHGSRRRPTKRR